MYKPERLRIRINVKGLGREMAVMTVQECYSEMGGDLGAALGVLESETRLRRYLIRFLDEPTARMLFLALEDARWEDAFRAAHTMKGLCRGLGLTRLYDGCCALADELRGGQAPLDDAVIGRVHRDYEAVTRAIRALGAEA